MLSLSGGYQIHLPPPRGQSARVLTAYSEQNKLRNIAEIESNAASVRAAVLTHLVPTEVGLVGEAPGLHHRESLRQQSVRTPQVEMRGWCGELLDRKGHDLVELHRAVT